jgi:hypothetical protein
VLNLDNTNNLWQMVNVQIREMAFVFEMNHKSVRQYLANVTKNTQEENTIFEWSPEGAHE